MFTSEHYNVIAAVLKRAMKVRYEEVHPFIMARLAEHFKADNPRFDERKFLIACGVPEEVLPHLPCDILGKEY